jgi:anion-transporting  ArsA/GET3 family ATPase
VPTENFRELGLEPTGELYAMMLDTKATFDHLITKYASSEAMRDNILSNRYYQHISSALAGTHEYMAMEKLYAIQGENQYDLIVVDTPPSRRALDFLEAPDRLTNLLSTHPLWKLLNPYLHASRWGVRVFNFFASPMLRLASHVLGAQMLQDIADFFRLADEALFEGFRQRAAAVRQLLRSPQALFLAIASPLRATLREALFLYHKLREYRMPFGGFIVNRVHPNYLNARGDKTRFRRFVETNQLVSEPLMQKLITNFHCFHKLAESDQEAIADLVRNVGPDVDVRQIPYFDRDIHDLAGLLQLAAVLVSGAA